MKTDDIPITKEWLESEKWNWNKAASCHSAECYWKNIGPWRVDIGLWTNGKHDIGINTVYSDYEEHPELMERHLGSSGVLTRGDLLRLLAALRGATE